MEMELLKIVLNRFHNKYKLTYLQRQIVLTLAPLAKCSFYNLAKPLGNIIHTQHP